MKPWEVETKLEEVVDPIAHGKKSATRASRNARRRARGHPETVTPHERVRVGALARARRVAHVYPPDRSLPARLPIPSSTYSFVSPPPRKDP